VNGRIEDVVAALGCGAGVGSLPRRAGSGSAQPFSGYLASVVGRGGLGGGAGTGFSERWIEKLVARWNAEGPDGLGDRRRGNGASPVLDAAGLAALAAALDEGPEDCGLWNGRKVAAWMSARLGRPVSPKLGLDYLHRLGFSRQWPRPRHAKAAAPEAQEAFKKTSPRRWMPPRPRRRAGGSSCGPSTSTASA
jgi:transposase